MGAKRGLRRDQRSFARALGASLRWNKAASNLVFLWIMALESPMTGSQEGLPVAEDALSGRAAWHLRHSDSRKRPPSLVVDLVYHATTPNLSWCGRSANG